MAKKEETGDLLQDLRDAGIIVDYDVYWGPRIEKENKRREKAEDG